MAELSIVFLRSGLALALALGLLWLVSLRLRDASIVDIFWGTGYGLVAAVAFASSDGAPARRLCVLALTAAWGLRLSIYLAVRNLGHGEDRRYQAIRSRVGPRFPWLSLFLVFWLQGALLWIVALPVQVAIAADQPVGLGLLDGLGIALWLTGFLFEAVGDLQLRRFLADPASRGQVLDTGLWRYTRHPNYFGNAVLWWGLTCFALATGAWWTVISPVLMTFLLVRVSGVRLLERSLVVRRPEYRAYIERTSAFIPWPPKRPGG